MRRNNERQLNLRPMREDEATYILELEARCMKEYAEALWGQFRPRLPEDVDMENAWIIQYDDGRSGCLVVTASETEYWIDCLYIEPELQNKGIGSLVLEKCIDEADARKLPLRLNVLTTNPALRFYLRHGLSIECETIERRQMVLLPAS